MYPAFKGSPTYAMLRSALYRKVVPPGTGVILSLLRCFIICPYMMVNPALSAPQSGYGVDNHMWADIL